MRALRALRKLQKIQQQKVKSHRNEPCSNTTRHALSFSIVDRLQLNLQLATRQRMQESLLLSKSKFNSKERQIITKDMNSTSNNNMTDITASKVLTEGRTAVITGASSGIGRAVAMTCAAKGMNVWLVDIDKEELDVAKDLVMGQCSKKEYQKIEARVVDVSDEKAMMGLSDEVFKDGGKCNFLMNNAGVGKGGGSMTEMETVRFTMGANTYGPIHGCLAFVPKMKESGEVGIIVNTGSKQGITMPPGNLTYNMSKAALKCYTEGLEHDLRGQEGGKLRAALLVPGWVNTSIMLKSIRADKLAKGEPFDASTVFFHEEKPAQGAWMPQQAVDFMIEELDKGKFYLICPDNDVDRETDKLRMTWTMQDITEDRPPLSRWHPDYKDKFTAFVEASTKK